MRKPGSRRTRAKQVLSREVLLARETHLLGRPASHGVPVAIGFPNSYSLGMSNLGFQCVYQFLAGLDGVQVQRFFCDPGGPGVRSLEEGQSLSRFRLLGYSLPYEADYIQVIRSLAAAGIPLRAAQRVDRDPLILLGGVAITANPRPLSPLADLIVVGESEEVLPVLLDRILRALESNRSRTHILERAADVPSLYVPSVHGEKRGEDLVRAQLSNMDRHPSHSVILTPETVFQDTLLVEIARGCQRGCRFCLTGHMSPRFRPRSKEAVLGPIEEHGKNVAKVGLVSAEVASHPDIEEIVSWIVDSGRQVSACSLEADRASPELIRLLAAGGQKTFALAPEAGNEEIRSFLGKKVSDSQLFSTVEEIAATEAATLKLYFLIGIPTVGPEETASIADLALRAADIFLAGRRVSGTARKLSVVLTPLVPKPFTPMGKKFSISAAGEIRSRVRSVRKSVAGRPGIRLSAVAVSEATTEHRITAGDSSVFDWLVAKARGGGCDVR